MPRFFSVMVLIAALWFAPAGLCRESNGFVSESLLRALRDSEVRLPTGAGSFKIEESVLREIDPKARILLRAEAAGIESEWPPVEFVSVWPKGNLYVKCLSLNSGAYDAITNALRSFTNECLRGVALDLRGTHGWNIDELEKVASCFLPEKSPLCRIFTGTGRYETTLKARGPAPLLAGIPVVLIVDEETDGTAEVLAGALSGREGILLMGRRTGGAACVRDLIPLGQGRFIHIATGWADWGDGVRTNVAPDILVEDELGSMVPQPRRSGRQSEELVDLLRQTASDEAARRASDFLLSRIRLSPREEDESKSTKDN